MSEMVQRLDDYGKPAWLVVMIVGFVLFWPVGLAVLAYLLWSGRMTCGWHGGSHRGYGRWQSRFERARSRVEDEVKTFTSGMGAAYSSGNRAFDEYREATLKRLEDEEREFRAFLSKLRQAKDKAEFDQFMTERRERPQDGDAPPTPSAA